MNFSLACLRSSPHLDCSSACRLFCHSHYVCTTASNHDHGSKCSLIVDAAQAPHMHVCAACPAKSSQPLVNLVLPLVELSLLKLHCWQPLWQAVNMMVLARSGQHCDQLSAPKRVQHSESDYIAPHRWDGAEPPAALLRLSN